MSQLPTRLGKLRLRDLVLLEYIHEGGTLREVAERLHVTQPAVTLALKVVEEAFGAKLVHRGRRGVRLTETGEAILQRLVVGRKELSVAYSLAVKPSAAHLRLGCTPLAAMNVLPVALARFLRTYTAREVAVTITESGVPRLWEKLNHGDLDAIVCRVPSAGKQNRIGSDTSFATVATERMVLVAHRDSSLGSGPLDMDLLASEAWALPPEDSVAYPMLTEWFVNAGFPPPVPTVRSTSFQANLMLVSKAGMVTLAPESVARSLAGALDLKIIESGGEWGRISIVFAHRNTSLHIDGLAELKQCFIGAPLVS